MSVYLPVLYNFIVIINTFCAFCLFVSLASSCLTSRHCVFYHYSINTITSRLILYIQYITMYYNSECTSTLSHGLNKSQLVVQSSVRLWRAVTLQSTVQSAVSSSNSRRCLLVSVRRLTLQCDGLLKTCLPFLKMFLQMQNFYVMFTVC